MKQEQLRPCDFCGAPLIERGSTFRRITLQQFAFHAPASRHDDVAMMVDENLDLIACAVCSTGQRQPITVFAELARRRLNERKRKQLGVLDDDTDPNGGGRPRQEA